MGGTLNSAAERSGTGEVAPLRIYVSDRDRPKARWRRRIAWTILIVGAFLYGAIFTFFPPAFIPPLLVPLLALTAVVIWALPTRERVPTGFLRWLFMGVLVSIVAWPVYLAVALPGLPWITMTRVFIIPLTIAFLLCLSLSREMRNDLKEVLSANRLIVRLLLTFVFLQFVSVFFSGNPFDSFEKFVIDQIYWTAMFFVACYLFRDQRVLIGWSWLLIGLAAFTCALGFWEWRLGRLPWLGHIPSFLQISDDSVLRALAGSTRAGAIGHRVQATFAVSLGFGEYLALTTPLAIHFAMEAKRLWLRALAALMLPVIFFTMIISGARIGSVGFVLAIILYTGSWAIERWRSDPRSIVGPAMTLGYPVVAGLMLALTFISGRLRQIVWGGSNTEGSNQARIDQFHMGWPKVLEWPLGQGVGQGGVALGYTGDSGFLTIDTYPLRLALEYGFLGLLVFYAFFLTGTIGGFRIGFRARDPQLKMLLPLSIALAVFLVGKTVYAQESNHPIPFMMMGAICAMIARSRAEASRQSGNNQLGG
jgi:hypothetical protein